MNPGSWLKALSWLVAKKNKSGAMGSGPGGPSAIFFLAMSLGPWAVILEGHEALTSANGLISTSIIIISINACILSEHPPLVSRRFHRRLLSNKWLHIFRKTNSQAEMSWNIERDANWPMIDPSNELCCNFRQRGISSRKRDTKVQYFPIAW